MSCYDPGSVCFYQGNGASLSLILCLWGGKFPTDQSTFSLSFLGAPPPIPKPAAPGTRMIPAALGAAPTAPSGRVPKAPSTKARPPPPRISAPVGSYKPRPAPPKVPAARARVASKPPARKQPKRQFYAAEYVAQRIAASLATAGRVAGAVFEDSLDQRGLPTPLGPQPASPPAAVVSTACTTIPSAEGSKAPVWAEELSAPMESDDTRVQDGEEPRLIIPLDPGIEDDGEALFRDDGPLGPLPEGLSPLRESDMEF